MSPLFLIFPGPEKALRCRNLTQVVEFPCKNTVHKWHNSQMSTSRIIDEFPEYERHILEMAPYPDQGNVRRPNYYQSLREMVFTWSFSFARI